MVFNGQPIEFANIQNNPDLTITLDQFLFLLDGIIQKDFENQCKNPIFDSKDANKTLAVFLYILLIFDLALLGLFIYFFIKVKRRKNINTFNSSISVDEPLLDDNGHLVN
jgi:hypothetical protein